MCGLQETELEDLFIAGDANQDGVLTFTEFREIISSADASVSNQNALRMFRETILLMPDGGDSISPQAFAAVAHAHGINAPDQIVFNLLKKTWDQVSLLQSDSQYSLFLGLFDLLMCLEFPNSKHSFFIGLSFLTLPNIKVFRRVPKSSPFGSSIKSKF